MFLPFFFSSKEVYVAVQCYLESFDLDKKRREGKKKLNASTNLPKYGNFIRWAVNDFFIESVLLKIQRRYVFIPFLFKIVNIYSKYKIFFRIYFN